MRYSGGLLGGTWLASLAADLGNGIFDGAWLVQNFENLNPANTFWDKYYNLFANIDTETAALPRVRALVGRLLPDEPRRDRVDHPQPVRRQQAVVRRDASAGGEAFDLRDIHSPIILFASLGDNITPPQQAFNWVADVYGSTEELKARGQVIVGLLHEEIGHLGIFVSGKVARKEHAQLVSVMQHIEMLPPGLYGMEIIERRSADGQIDYAVEFHEKRLEEIVARLNRFQRADEKPFAAVEALSEFNQRAYQLFAQPWVQAMSSDASAELLRELHPLRVQHWGISDRNPWLWWLAPAAAAVKAQRQKTDTDALPWHWERFGSELISASLDHYRAMRDAMGEAQFFQIYGSLFGLYLTDRTEDAVQPVAGAAEPRQLAFVAEALASMREGGYSEAFARVSALLARHGDLPLSLLATRHELAEDYADLLPEESPETWRRIRGEQEIIAHYEPEQAIASLADLLAETADRERLLTLLERLLQDERVQRTRPTAEQLAMLARIRDVLSAKPATRRRASARRRITKDTVEHPHDRQA